MIRKIITGFLFAGSMLMASAETFVWTGANSGKWTDPGNWTVDGIPASRCPGVPADDAYVTIAGGFTDKGQARIGDAVEFGQVVAGASVTIDLSGLYCVKAITFKSGCPCYTLGTSAEQVVPLEAFSATAANSGKFIVERGAELPVLVAGFSVGVTCGTICSGNVTALTVQNDAEGALQFASVGHSRNPGRGANRQLNVFFSGEGGFRFNEDMSDMDVFNTGELQYTAFTFSQKGKVTFAASEFSGGAALRGDDSHFGLWQVTLKSDGIEMEILEGCRVSLSPFNGPALIATENALISGAGTFMMCYRGAKSGTSRGYINVASGVTLRIDAQFSAYNEKPTTGDARLVFYAGTGTLELFGPTNGVAGVVEFGPAATLRVDKCVNFGAGEVVQMDDSGVIDYAGMEDSAVLAKSFQIANGKVVTIRNTGTSMLEVDSAFVPSSVGVQSFAVTVQPESAPIVFSGEIGADYQGSATLIKDGAGKLVISADADLSNVDSLRLCAGELDLSPLVVGKVATFQCPLTFDSGAVTVNVPDGKVYELGSVVGTTGTPIGTLNFICGTGRVRLAGKQAGEVVPSGVLVNGVAAEFREGGVLAPVAPSYDVGIASKGDEVPNDASKTVGVVREGAGEDTVLATAETGVKSLVQLAENDTVIAMSEGDMLSAGSLLLAGFGGNFTIGSESGVGLLAGSPSGSILLANDDRCSLLKINAALAADTNVRVEGSAGRMELAGGAVSQAKLDVYSGMLTLSGEPTFNLGEVSVGTNADFALPAKVLIDGAKDVVFGSGIVSVGHSFADFYDGVIARMLITNSLVRNADLEIADWTSSRAGTGEHTLCVGNNAPGILEICDGAIVSNRLLVGGVYTKTKAGSSGAVIQRGGEMAVVYYDADDASTKLPYTSAIGANGYCNGYYRLDEGRFSAPQLLGIGNYTTGTFEQNGGEAIMGELDIGGANGGNGVAVFSGGRTTLAAFTLASGVTGAKALAVIEDGGDVTASSVYNSSARSGCQYRANLVLNGGMLTTGGICQRKNADATADNRMFVSFDGGTIRKADATASLFTYHGVNYTNPTHVVIHKGGATIDTNGKKNIIVNSVLEGATGKGVKSISFSGSWPCVAPPVVEIVDAEGSGYGAAAVVDFDAGSREIVGIRVVSPGCNYTKAVAKFYIYNSYVRPTESAIDCELADNENTGAFTKAGEGDLALQMPNTYGGDTILAGGELKAAVLGAIPANSTVVFAGGKLTCTEGVSMPLNYAVDAVAAQERGAAFEYSGDLTFPDGAILTVRRAEELGELQKPMPLLRVSGTLGGKPEIVCPGLDASKYKVTWHGNTLKVSPNLGMLLIVR